MGAATLSPAALSLLTTIFEEGPERNRALGVWGAVAGSSGAVGVLLGGVVTTFAGWQWILFINLPIGLLAAALAPRLLPESRAAGQSRSFDLAGAASVTGGLTLLVYVLLAANGLGWASVTTAGLLALVALLFAAFVLIESRSWSPLVPFRIFRLGSIGGANVVGLFVGASLLSMFFFISLYMQQVLGYGALQAGLAYLPLAVTITVVAAGASVLVTRFGFRVVLLAGLVLVAGSLAWFSRVPVDGSYVRDILFPSLIAGAGLGLCFVSITVAAVSGVPVHETGLASGLINTSQQVGAALGLALLSAVATSRTAAVMAAAGGHPAPPAQALTEGFRQAFAVGALLAAIGLVLTLLLLRRPVRGASAPAKEAA